MTEFTHEVIGCMVRNVRGKNTVLKHGALVTPTPTELAMWPDKFKPLQRQITIEQAVAMEQGVNFTELTKLQDRLKDEIIATKEEWENDVVKEAEAFLRKNPKKQETVDNLVLEIMKFFEDLEEEEIEEGDK